MRAIIIFFTVVIGVAAISALVTLRFVDHRPQNEDAMHRWLHNQLNLTVDQKKALEKIEERFAADESRLQAALAQANRELAIVIRDEGTYTPKVSDAVENIHRQMGELQKLSIAHLFEMTTVLAPEQKEKLMDYAELALSRTH